ncbi:PAS domain-containing protein [candidate division GN15 bacterium]|nr:PAS domain-containing protein [candidate division GN15 bacterium]
MSLNKERDDKHQPAPLESIPQRQLLEQLPSNVAIIDRDYNIVEANGHFEDQFGEWRGKKCYEVYKKADQPCDTCPSMEIFNSGEPKVSDEVGIDQHGRQTHYVVHSAPLQREPGGPIEYIIEMSIDVTETKRWQREYNILFDRVPCYVTVIDSDYRIIRSNEAFRDRFGQDVRGQHCYEVYKRRKRKCPHCPATMTFKDGKVHKSNQVGVSKTEERTDYIVTTSPLMRGPGKPAHVIEICTDVTEMKKLESEMIDAERLAAVGQTVAGLAHSVKNILMGLEGGKYIVSLGLQKEDKQLIEQGWEMLERNFDKTTQLVKDFLSFAKGRLPEVRPTNPNELVAEIVELYHEVARQAGIELRANLDQNIKPAPLDPDGIHTCLTNLVSNSIDACEMSEKSDCYVEIRTRYKDGNLIFEVVDNGSGIDYDIKKKIFTTFFTTKGGKGTGLGLLTTRKIVQEHGGKIRVQSERGEGARFRITLPRKRLQMLADQQKQAREQAEKEARESAAGMETKES